MSTVVEKVKAKHPLQRLQSPSRGLSILLHFIGLCSFTGSFRHLINQPSPINEAYGWHWQYLTINGLALATGSFVCGLLADLTLSPRLFFAKNILALCSAPLELVITILYWGISAIDRKLLVPPEIPLAPIADVGFHAMPAILLTLDLIFFSPPWTIEVLPAMGISSVIAFAYWYWVELCNFHNGWYIYPFFGLLSTSQRVLIFTGAAILMTGSTMCLKWLYGRVNGWQGQQIKANGTSIKGE